MIAVDLEQELILNVLDPQDARAMMNGSSLLASGTGARV